MKTVTFTKEQIDAFRNEINEQDPAEKQRQLIGRLMREAHQQCGFPPVRTTSFKLNPDDSVDVTVRIGT